MTKDILSVPLHRFLAAARQLEQDARFAADELAALCDVRVTAPVEARGALDAEAVRLWDEVCACRIGVEAMWAFVDDAKRGAPALPPN